METTKKQLWKKAVSLMLAAMMVVTAFVIPSSEEVMAASAMQFKGTGTSSVTITDDECFSESGTANTHYIKFKAGATGTITVKMSNASSEYAYSYGYLTFCNSKKKVIGRTKEAWSTNYSDSAYYTRTYGVKKGQTYYFAVQSASGVKVSATVKAVKKGKNTSKSKATKLNAGKKATGVIIAGDSKADWYKISVNGNQRVKLSYSAKTNGDVDKNGIKVTFCNSNGKKFLSNSSDWVSPFTPSSWTKYFRRNSVTGKETGLASGTYYIKVERYNKTSSGSYTLSWKAY